jgi:hypothetical protein
MPSSEMKVALGELGEVSRAKFNAERFVGAVPSSVDIRPPSWQSLDKLAGHMLRR